MKRFFIFLLPLPLFAVHHEWVRDEFYHADGSGVIGSRVRCSICGIGNVPVGGVSGGWCTCHSPQRSVLVRSYSLGTSDEDDPEMTEGRIASINGSLADMPSDQQAAIDWDNLPTYDMEGGSWDWNYLEPGTVVGGGSGVVSGGENGGSPHVVDVVGGQASGYDSNGKPGVWTVSPIGDNNYGSSWTPSWYGGATDNGASWSDPSSSSLPLAPENIPDIPMRDNGSGTPEVYIPAFNPSVNIEVPSSSSTPSPVYVNVNMQMHDYSGILTAILKGIYSGFDREFTWLTNFDQNMRNALVATEAPDVAEYQEPAEMAPDTSSVNTEVEEQLDLIREEGSGWGFDFGMGSNPIGTLITSMIGNPPTSFGTQDQVCQINFPIWGDFEIEYTFRLSDWFPAAFRSCMLMILSVVFAIASAKAVSGAFK